jgi:AcrR family transcriptional regulator
MYVRGVNATILDDVRAATGTSKSQLYRHFPDKETLVHAVIAARGKEVLERERQRLERLSSFSGLVRWRKRSCSCGDPRVPPRARCTDLQASFRRKPPSCR